VAFTSTSVLYGNDQVLNYALELLKNEKAQVDYDKEGNEISVSNSDVDSNYKYIAKSFYLLGYQEKAIHLFEKLALEDTRHQFLRDLIQSRVKKKRGTWEAIKGRLSTIKDKVHRQLLNKMLILDHLRNGKIKNVLELLKERNRLINSIKGEDDDYMYYIGDSLFLVVPLLENGLAEPAEQILEDAEKIFSSQGDLEFMGILLDTYIQLNRIKKINWLINKMQDVSRDNPGKLFQTAEYLLKLERYADAEKLLVKAFFFFKEAGIKEKVTSDFAGFIALNHIFDRPVVFNFIKNNSNIREIIKKSATIKNQSQKYAYTGYPFSGMNDKVIEFLIKTGSFSEAKTLAKKMDDEVNSHKHRDYYYYRMGLVFDRSFKPDTVVRMARNIKMRSFAVDLFLRAARFYRQADETGKFIMTMNDAEKLLANPQHDPMPMGRVGDVVLEWLEGECIDRALEAIRFEKNNAIREELLFEVAQRLIAQHSFDKTGKIIKEFEDFDYKALTWSKIAAMHVLSGKEKEGIDFFKKAIRLVIENQGSYLSYILSDYVSAVKDRKLINTTLWRNSKSVD
jgi:tetratricopeptide (TPR) repeat protein